MLVGPEHSDDAAVYRISDELALVSTVDIIPPVVDDPVLFGEIAAANALSDIYAMGAKPLFALSIAAFPEKQLPGSVLFRIMEGVSKKVAEAGITIIGGHTIEDNEPKFGLAITGIIHPDRILRNRGALPGDVLVLTKPIGIGIWTTSMKRRLATTADAKDVLSTMTRLNKESLEAAEGLVVHACTDVTGFGLLGHLKEMIRDTKTDALLRMTDIPVLDKTWHYAAAGMIPGGSRNNLDFVEDTVIFDDSLSDIARFILADAQTSGGLLMSMSPDAAETYIGNHRDRGLRLPWIIGKIEPGDGKIRMSS